MNSLRLEIRKQVRSAFDSNVNVSALLKEQGVPEIRNRNAYLNVVSSIKFKLAQIRKWILKLKNKLSFASPEEKKETARLITEIEKVEQNLKVKLTLLKYFNKAEKSAYNKLKKTHERKGTPADHPDFVKAMIQIFKKTSESIAIMHKDADIEYKNMISKIKQAGGV